jgi:hypothetical protein
MSGEIGNVRMTLSPLAVRKHEIDRLNVQLDKQSSSIASGGLGGAFSDMRGDTSSFISAQADLSSIEARSTYSSILLERQNRINSLISRAQELNTQVLSYLTNTRVGTTGAIDGASFAAFINQNLSALTSILNTDDSGKYLFSGISSQSAAVNVSALTALAYNSGPDTSYYSGGSGSVTFNIDDTRSLTKFSTLANASCFEQTFRALRMCLNVTSDPTADDANIGSAISLLSNASQIGYPTTSYIAFTQSKAIRESIDASGQDKLSAQERLSSSTGEDLFGSFMELQSLKTTIELAISMAIQEQKILDDLINRF